MILSKLGFRPIFQVVRELLWLHFLLLLLLLVCMLTTLLGMLLETRADIMFSVA